ncbi:hypothetical protein MKW98_009885 [Papaver atlanticum]|uniref:Transmembrane protein n=1 Tax=Papaver atlanticum TaxID=357466 RepID=A0AAD4XET7_9MAGN|nr:hypothetical protein MKW98_009885 [Papaver atlanticum]
MEKVGKDWVYEVLKASTLLLHCASSFFFIVQVFAAVFGSDDPLLQHNSVVFLRVFRASFFCNLVGVFCVNPSSRREYHLFKKFIHIISVISSSFFMVLGCRLWISFTAQHP